MRLFPQDELLNKDFEKIMNVFRVMPTMVSTFSVNVVWLSGLNGGISLRR